MHSNIGRGINFMILEDYSVDVKKDHATLQFSEKFGMVFKNVYNSDYSDIIILCIGTDRSTGDCLGPLVGYKLKHIKYSNICVQGTLNEPVHAKNLEVVMDSIYKKFRRPFIIGIDACLGKPDRIGCISVGKGPLRPGAGVNKSLPEIGNMHVIGVVNISGFMEYLILQNTRLSLVMRMAETISSGIYFNLWKHVIKNNTSVKNPL